MDTEDGERAVERLQQLGLKTYEASCLVGLTRTETATARELAEVTDVPRTRVYDAVRVLEEEGLVEVQHGTPRRFRAVPVEEVVETLRSRFEPRIEELGETLRALERVDGDLGVDQEVWALSGRDAVGNRVDRLVGEAEREAVAVVDEPFADDDSLAAFDAATDRGVATLLWATTDRARERARAAVPDARTLDRNLGWLVEGEGGPAFGRVVVVDREAVLASVVDPTDGEERAVVSNGSGTGLVVVARRLLAAQVGAVEDYA
jgi:sugar-specific transcriptional regulator TrmB